MKISRIYKTLAFGILLFANASAFAQARAEDEGGRQLKSRKEKGFHLGFSVGSLFANKYTASVYDGYGFDVDGYKHDFASSAMNQKINYEYGGRNGQVDRIAQALNVNSGDWSFDESDMPVNMKYNPAILVALNMRYCVDKRNSIIFNANGSKLTAGGLFTITTTTPQIGIPTPTLIRTFSIIGGEQRLVLELGYQGILGDNDKLNVFVEGGLACTMVKFDRNLININGLIIDLTTYYDPQGLRTYQQKNMTGVAFGAFAGIGLNLSMSPKWTTQLVYDPSYEKVNIGDGKAYKFQHTLALRAFYNL